MFTGIIREVGDVIMVRRSGASAAVRIALGELAGQVQVGDSVLVDGVCLTATGVSENAAEFDLSSETLRLSTLAQLRTGGRVNLELAMLPTDRFGGHFVSGHVDATGQILASTRLPGQTRLKVKVAPTLTELMVMKGSVAVDGISLTIAALGRDNFEVSLIPHTLAVTTLGEKGPGDAVNVECDMIGKWIRKFVGVTKQKQQETGLTLDRLREEGY